MSNMFYFCMISLAICLGIVSYFTLHVEFRNMVSGDNFLKRDNVVCYNKDEIEEDTDDGEVDDDEN